MAFPGPGRIVVCAASMAFLLLLASCAPLEAPDSGVAKIRITYVGDAPRVCLVGDFNDWDGQTLCRETRAGRTEFALSLPPGRYGYGFWVDGEILPDREAGLLEDDGFGGMNSMLLVP